MDVKELHFWDFHFIFTLSNSYQYYIIIFRHAKNNNMARQVCSGLKPTQHPRCPLSSPHKPEHTLTQMFLPF